MSPKKELNGRISFLPHHAVRRRDCIKIKLRVVFDGSCKSPNSNSLTSVLGVGQILQPDIFTLLVRFKINEIAFTADIKQMYRQILIDPEDQNLQKIVWRKSLDSNIKEYKLSTVTYGTASAPFLATRCLHQISLDCKPQIPELSSIIQNSFIWTIYCQEHRLIRKQSF
ncbi:reverse transcriptase domain-containing protein [Trichonephila clavipes]|nr:reverse transcriptase domain-containing protein [Trichonephila clavipes]